MKQFWRNLETVVKEGLFWTSTFWQWS